MENGTVSSSTTVKQLAEACGVSKSTVVRYIDDLDLREGHTAQEGKRRTLVIDGYAASLIADKLMKDKGKVPSKEDLGDDTDGAVAFGAVVEAYKDQVETLRAELRDAKQRETDTRNKMDAQLAAKDRQIEELLSRVEAAQRETKAEREARSDADTLIRQMAGASVWQRLRGFKGLLPGGGRQ